MGCGSEIDNLEKDLAEFSVYFSEKSPQPMLAVEGRTHRISYVNNAFENLVGINRSQLLGRQFKDAVPEGEDNKCLPLLDRVYSSANPEILLEQEHSNFDPPVYWSYFVWQILGGPDKRPIGVMIQVTDTTESVNFKNRLKEANQELLRSSVKQHELAAQIEQAAKELRFKTQELESIIGIVSHDLRAPLVNIRGFSIELTNDYETILELLSKVDIPAEIAKQLDFIFQHAVPESLGFIKNSANSMDNLVKSLVEVARVGLEAVKPEKVDMNEIMGHVFSNFQIKLKQAHAQVQAGELVPCWADKSQVVRIFTNLVDNAVKYLDPGRQGVIGVSGTVRGDHAVYCVTDNGLGIAPEDQGRVFEIFTRLAQIAEVGGEGMGLAMVKRMVDRNNGEIWIESEKGKGSRFFVALPLPPAN